jgi:oligoendopeptidase F
MMERVTDISALTLLLEAKFADPAFARWRPYLRDLRVYRPHQLSDELERFMHERDVTGRAAWSRLFDETIAGMRVQVGGERPDRQRRAEQAVRSDRACARPPAAPSAPRSPSA